MNREGASMSIFASQFDRARVYTGMYTGQADDTAWRTTRGAATGRGGLFAGAAVVALAAGGVGAGVAAAAAIDAFFDGDTGADAHHAAPQEGPADPHAHGQGQGHGHLDGHAAGAHAGMVSAPAPEAGGVGSPGDGGVAAHGHADAWGANWGTGWDDGWDAESSHRLAAGGHAETAAAGHESDRFGGVADRTAHQMFAESTGTEPAHADHGQAESGPAPGHPATVHLDQEHLDRGGHEKPSSDGPGYDGPGHDGPGYDEHGATDHYVNTGHEEAWAHGADHAGHADHAGFGGDGDGSAFHVS